jgi:DNA-binding CsgD family transcriptional regulator
VPSSASAVDVVDGEVRELIRRRGLDPFIDPAPIRLLVRDVVADYSERSLSSALPPIGDAETVVRDVLDRVAGFGPLQRWLDDPEVEEIWVNAGRVYRSFLWPSGGHHAPGGHVRITVLASAENLPIRLTGLVLVSPPGDLRGLTPRELEVLGLLIDGYSNAAIARALVVAPRTVAAHLEHILVKLAAPSRTLAAVRAEQAGLYVPFPGQQRRTNR